MKKCFLFSIAFLGSSLNAYEGVIKQDANVREKNNLNSKIVKVHLKNTKIDIEKKVYSKYGTWYKTKDGYISIDLVQVVDSSNIKEKEISKKNVAYKSDFPLEEKVNKSKEKIQKKENISEANLVKKIVNKDKYFLGVSFNLNHLNVKKNDIYGQIDLTKELEDKKNSYTINVGRVFNNKYLVSYNYEYLDLNEIDLESHYISLDYKFDTYLTPYVGLSLGYSSLKWNIDPLNNSEIKDTKASSFMYGVQSGIIYPLTDNLNFIGNISYKRFDLKTKLKSLPAVSEIVHKNKSSLGFGIRYNF